MHRLKKFIANENLVLGWRQFYEIVHGTYQDIIIYYKNNKIQTSSYVNHDKCTCFSCTIAEKLMYRTFITVRSLVLDDYMKICGLYW